MTSVTCKLMESIIRDHVLNYFMHGFIKGRSTTLQLLRILDDWTNSIDSGGQIDCMNFEKAFDTVPHKRLISKLLSYSVNRHFLMTDILEFALMRNFKVGLQF